METIDKAYSVLLWISAAFMAVFVGTCLVRAILGPRFTDRVVAINIIVTQTIIMIAILSCLFRNGNLLDIAIVYATVGFLAMVVLSKCYIMDHHTDPVDLNIKNREEA